MKKRYNKKCARFTPNSPDGCCLLTGPDRCSYYKPKKKKRCEWVYNHETDKYIGYDANCNKYAYGVVYKSHTQKPIYCENCGKKIKYIQEGK